MRYSQKLVKSAVDNGLFKSFYAVAKDRGKSPTYINSLKNGSQDCTPYISAYLSEKMGMNPLLGIALVQIEKSKDDKEEEYWKGLIVRLQKEEDFSLESISYKE